MTAAAGSTVGTPLGWGVRVQATLPAFGAALSAVRTTLTLIE